jgi:hypothetical protein
MAKKGKGKNKNKSQQHVPTTQLFSRNPSLASTIASSSESNPSVRDLLERLRREQAPKASLEQIENVSRLGTVKSFPEEIRNILHLPEATPVISRRRNNPLRRRTPGPPPPRSWITSASSSAYNRSQKSMMPNSANQERTPNPVALLDIGSQNLPQRGSLMDYALASIARNWDFVRVYDFNNISLLPTSIKAPLVSYLSLYGSEVDLESLQQILFDDVSGTQFTEDIARLDLTGLISPSLSLKDIKTLFCPTKKRPGVGGLLRKLHLEDAERKIDIGGSSNVDPEDSLSWEQKADQLTTVPVSPIGMNFPNLTHLSLAKAGKYSSWAQLLDVAIHLKTLTHLSLAHWPIPSMVPTNSKWLPHAPTPSMFDFRRPGEVNRNLFWEATDILRRLSNRTYCLQWLDLEGCNGWLAALTWSGDGRGRSKWESTSLADSRSTNHPDFSSGVDWCSSWVQVRYVNLAQGWVPENETTIRSSHVAAAAVKAALLSHLKARDREPMGAETKEVSASNVDSERPRGFSARAAVGEGKRRTEYIDSGPEDTAQWLLNEQEAWMFRKQVTQLRARHGPYCKLNLGWGDFAE